MTLNLWILVIGFWFVVGVIVGAKWSDWRAKDTIKGIAQWSFDAGYNLGCRLTESKYSHKGFIINWDKELEQIIKDKL